MWGLPLSAVPRLVVVSVAVGCSSVIAELAPLAVAWVVAYAWVEA